MSRPFQMVNMLKTHMGNAFLPLQEPASLILQLFLFFLDSSFTNAHSCFQSEAL